MYKMVLIGVSADAANIGANWMCAYISEGHIQTLNQITKVLSSNPDSVLKYIGEVSLDNFCEFYFLEKWPYKDVPPENNLGVYSQDELQTFMTDAQFNSNTVRTDYHRVMLTSTGQVFFMADFKHSAAYEGTIASYQVDIADLMKK